MYLTAGSEKDINNITNNQKTNCHMKKKFFYYFLLTFTLLNVSLTSCGDDDDVDLSSGDKKEQTIVGQWSGVREVTSPIEDVYMHWNFNADGTVEQIMEAWAEKRTGTYSDNKKGEVKVHITDISWLWDRENGYSDVFEQYGYADFEAFKKDRPEEVDFTMEYSFNSDGTLRLSNSPFGLDLIYVKNPGYQPKKHIY